MKTIFRIASLSCLAMLVFIAQAVTADAQGRYANVYSRSQVENFVRQLENSSDQFHTSFTREVNNSGLSNSTRRTYNNYADRFETAVDRLRSRFDSNDSWWESRNEVQNVVSDSQNLNSVMNSAAFRRRIERQWNQLRNDINRLADAYDLPGLSGGGWTGGGGGWNNNPGRGGNVPNWALGTFYARNPQTGGVITMTIDQRGSVQIVFDGGQPTYGTMNGTTLINGPYRNRVTRLNNGIRTTNVANGDFIDYYRTAPNGGWNPGGGGIPGNVPNWATGTFYARNPQTGGIITMSIQRNGTVTIDFGDGNQSYASMSGTRLVNGPYVNNVTRINNGIRTTNIANGDFIDYYRNRPR